MCLGMGVQYVYLSPGTNSTHRCDEDCTRCVSVSRRITGVTRTAAVTGPSTAVAGSTPSAPRASVATPRPWAFGTVTPLNVSNDWFRVFLDHLGLDRITIEDWDWPS